MSTSRALSRIIGLITAVVLVFSGIVVGSIPASAASPKGDGAAAETAAASCWEIKQDNPSASDGTYWLLTPNMDAPDQFYCDMTTDGGGWVLIGKGREGWSSRNEGTGSPAALRMAGLNPMSRTTTQYSAQVVDGLINGGRVDALADGIRLKRAKNASGTEWQESRFNIDKGDRWVWTFGAEHRVAWYSFDGVRGTGGLTSNFGPDSAYRRITTDTSEVKAQGYTIGFSYGASVTGTSSSTSYLWSATDGLGSARPYTEMYLRPQLRSADAGFTPIGNGGTKAKTNVPVVSSVALDSPWGVTGPLTPSREGDVEVQAFVQSGNRMYVGGNFTYVQRAANSTGTDKVSQAFLAAFDISTGELIRSFTPKLNGSVMALAALPNGNIVAAGMFGSANGSPATAIVALDPTTGATAANWSVKVEDRRASGVLRVSAMSVHGSWLYLGGAFTHLTGGSRPDNAVYAKGAARVSVADGTPGTGWNPEFNGTVVAIDAADDGSRLYAAGYFSTAGTAGAPRAAAVQTTAGAALATPAWSPVWSSTNKDYQQTIGEVGSRVWVGGSEHSFFSYSTTTFDRLSGDIGKKNGDFQTMTTSKAGVIYAGSHGHDWNYSNAFTWPNVGTGWTQADSFEWVGAWDASTGDIIPNFTPSMKFRLGQGAWASTVDSNGSLWVGGDMTTAMTRSSGSKWSSGFARFPQTDATAPTTPAKVTLSSDGPTTVKVAWSAANDNSGGVTYQVLRDDRVIATTSAISVVVPKGGDNRYFVRSIDAAANLSPSSAVVTAGVANPSPVAAFTSTNKGLTVAYDASSSTDDGSIVGYGWNFGDATTGQGSAASHTYKAAGTYTVTLTVTDDKGATAVKSAPVTVTAPANTPPQAAFTSKVSGLAVSVDGSQSSDPDGSIAAYAWDFGDAGTAQGATAAHTYKASGTYTVKLTVTDDKGATGVKTASVTATGTASNPVDTVVVPANSSWSWRFETTAPPATWKDPGFNASTWKAGPGVLGFGSTGLNTDIDINGASSGRPLAAYFIKQFTIDSTAQVQKLILKTVANDGVVIYVNGTEVGRSNMPAGDVTFNTYALSASSSTSANSNPVTFGVPVPLLVDGVNTIAVETHLNYRATRDIGFDLTATSTSGGDGGGGGTPPNETPVAKFSSTVSGLVAAVDGSGSSDADGSLAAYTWDFGDGGTASGATASHTYAAAGTYPVTLKVTDNNGATGTTSSPVTVASSPTGPVQVVPAKSSWSWRYDQAAPDTTWRDQGFDASTWKVGAGVLGFGTTALGTNIDINGPTSDRPRAAYFISQFNIDAVSDVASLVLKTVADDGVIVYVNGTEVGRRNMPTGPATINTYASTAIRTSVANANPLDIDVPVSLLVNGINTIAVETHLNYRSTPDLSFDLSATANRR